MRCPFLEEVRVAYCQAFPIKKMIPAGLTSMTSPCGTEGHETCPVYQDCLAARGIPTPPARIPAESEPASEKECVWMTQEDISYRLCTKNYDCSRCEFEQMLVERDGKYVEPPDIGDAVAKMREMPGYMRKCKYMLLGKVRRKPCYKDYRCWDCPVYQQIRHTILESTPRAPKSGTIGQ